MEEHNRVVIADHVISLSRIVYAKKHFHKTKAEETGEGKVTPIRKAKEKCLVVLDNETEIVLDCTLQEFIDAIPARIVPSEELTEDMKGKVDDKGTVQQ